MLLRVSIPVEAGNAAAKTGTLGTTIERILADLKPEAAYFFADDSGQRSGSIVFDMKGHRRFRRLLSLGFSRSTPKSLCDQS
jgi:hypothetical protein